MGRTLKTILVTGCNGFIGGQLARVAAARGFDVIGLDLIPRPNGTDFLNGYIQQDLSREDAFLSLKKSIPANIDAVIHAAGKSSVPGSLEDPNSDFMAGPAALQKVLEWTRTTNPEAKLLFLSSAAVYGNPRQLPISENTPIRPISPYGYHKSICEMLGQEYASLYGLKVAHARIFSAYGPGLNRQVVYDLMRRVFDHPKELKVYGTGDETRDFMYIDDVIDALLLVLQKGSFQGDAINIASGNHTTIRALAETILRVFRKDISLLSFENTSQPGMPQLWQADVSKLSALGFSPVYDIAQGLQKAKDYFFTEAT